MSSGWRQILVVHSHLGARGPFTGFCFVPLLFLLLMLGSLSLVRALSPHYNVVETRLADLVCVFEERFCNGAIEGLCLVLQ